MLSSPHQIGVDKVQGVGLWQTKTKAKVAANQAVRAAKNKAGKAAARRVEEKNRAAAAVRRVGAVLVAEAVNCT
jgi:hypothetical protein